ncbi:hypothetical protein KCP69_26220 [Salmonella enterica subsp. enterica]|nr:hypothetical protein KCP69_26220 [Salmonella enterica subsp. enterica]
MPRASRFTRRVCGWPRQRTRPFNADKREEVKRRVKHLSGGRMVVEITPFARP